MTEREPTIDRDTDTAKLLEQYKLYVQMADKISDRRADANKFFISLLTGLLALLSAIIQFRGAAVLQQAVLLIVGVVGILLCYTWYITIRSYRQLNSGKFKVVHLVEKQLPFSFYDVEWDFLGRGKDPKLYIPLTHVEQYIPKLFGILYAVLLAAGVWLLIVSYLLS
ncbi:MAG: RipA family octameric membrane protein [Halobacteriota archaeon]